ncbi:DUF4260 domain-containing protein [Wenyingzhuangia marina]|uniref:DUF4260 domain-containing protein n=1 Tax=Wenyingzhuangia marina TaxID=1195760 RepID=A0A1M5S4K4_9FLAO|nr:DUF4260 domain-containing protein [Wenyingzhuangia marina]GGF78857.1 hypothetical protein GCM10011397_22380 [Wenyingzhuangia marina]SHH33414.1 protein of unknown function [Wenyingzhuangia marina]
MNKLLKLEEFGQFLLSIVLFSQLNFSLWVFPACLLLPDFSMVGYLINSKTGAWLYNIFHHKLLGIFFYSLGLWLQNETIMLIGIILFGHSAMDRIFGYGLKYNDDFKHTHLGRIGKE